MTDLPEAGHTKRRREPAALLIAAGLFAAAIVIVVDMQRIATAGAYDRIGPTTVPYLVAAGLVLLAAGTAIQAWRGKFPAAEPQELLPVAVICGALLAQMLLIPFAGFIVASAALFTGVAFGFGERRVHLTLPFALVFSAIIWFVFSQLLKLTLPAGPLETWLASLLRGGA